MTVQSVALLIVGALNYLMGRERQEMKRQTEVLEKRMDAAPSMEYLRTMFVSRERIDDLLRESHGEHAEMWDEIKRIRDRNGK